MQASKIKSNLELVTNVAVLLVATAILCLIAWNYFAKSNNPSLKKGLQKDEIISGLNQVDLKKSKQTLFIALSTTCHFCVESVPFYNRLITDRQTAIDNATQIIAVFPNSENEVKQFAQQYNLSANTAFSTNFQSLGVNGTPTLILIDSDGKILDFWIGKLQEHDEQQVLIAISSGIN